MTQLQGCNGRPVMCKAKFGGVSLRLKIPTTTSQNTTFSLPFLAMTPGLLVRRAPFPLHIRVPHLSPIFRRMSTLEQAAHPNSKIQIWVSNSSNPHLNLSFENELLKKTPQDSNVLFLYSNAECVILGRNQNPWVEVNLTALNRGIPIKGRQVQNFTKPFLIRRLSGGGTVFHDRGNVNWSVISPSEGFERDKHVHMVVRALQKLGFANTRVNERHDIVMDLPGEVKPLKVSGSAYKITRGRCLHHGTLLLNSPNLGWIGHVLNSTAAPFISARGSQSVRSPVANVGYDKAEKFIQAVSNEFSAMYGKANLKHRFGKNILECHEIAKGMEELQVRKTRRRRGPVPHLLT